MEFWILNIIKYFLWIFICLLFTEKIDFLLVKQENFDQENYLFLSFKLVLRSWKNYNKYYVIFKIQNSNFCTLANQQMGYQGHKIHIFFVTSQGKIGLNSMLLQYLCTYWIKIIIIYLFTNKCIKIATACIYLLGKLSTLLNYNF